MSKADSLSSVQLETTLEIIKKFKATPFPAKYVANAMYDMSYDQLEVKPSTQQVVTTMTRC